MIEIFLIYCQCVNAVGNTCYVTDKSKYERNILKKKKIGTMSKNLENESVNFRSDQRQWGATFIKLS